MSNWTPWGGVTVLKSKAEGWDAGGSAIDFEKTSEEVSGLGELGNSEGAQWAPTTGTIVNGKQTVGCLHEDLDIINIFFKKVGGVAQKCLNINADQYVADAILGVLNKRYPMGSYKLEYYGQYKSTVNVDRGAIPKEIGGDRINLLESAMSVVLKTPITIAGDEYKRETYKLIDEAISGLKED